MKKFILSLSIIVFAACNTGAGSSNTGKTSNTDTARAVTTSAAVPKPGVSVKGIVDGYLHLKNALTADNGNEAAAAGKEILAAMSKIDVNTMDADQKKGYANVADDIKENAEHISNNAGKIAHQREHFEMLSQDIADLVKVFGNGGQTLYKDFCPMYNDGKGATWISETKEIKNPYLGKAMPTCGTMKEELK